MFSKTYLYEKVEDTQRYDDGEEYGGAVADDEDNDENPGGRGRPDPDHLGHVHVHDVQLPGEPVHDPPQRGRVKVGHGGSHDVQQQVRVQEVRGVHSGHGQGEAETEAGDC